MLEKKSLKQIKKLQKSLYLDTSEVINETMMVFAEARKSVSSKSPAAENDELTGSSIEEQGRLMMPAYEDRKVIWRNELLLEDEEDLFVWSIPLFGTVDNKP